MGTLTFRLSGLTDEETKAVRAKLNEVAASLGYHASRRYAGQGHAAALLVAIAQGNAIVKTQWQMAGERIAAEVSTSDVLHRPGKVMEAIRSEWEAYWLQRLDTNDERYIAQQFVSWMLGIWVRLRDHHDIGLSHARIHELIREIGGPPASEALQNMERDYIRPWKESLSASDRAQKPATT